MSKEITVKTQLLCKNDAALLNDVSTPQLLTLTPDQSAPGVFSATFDITTSDTAVTIGGDVSSPGWCWFRNLDDTNYVDWGPNNAGAILAIGRMLPTETAGPFRLKPSAALRMQAHTATCKVKIFALQT